MNKVDSTIKEVIKGLSPYLLKDTPLQDDQVTILKYYKDLLQNRLDSDILNTININDIIKLCLRLDDKFLNMPSNNKVNFIKSEEILSKLGICKSVVHELAYQFYKTKVPAPNYESSKEKVLSIIASLKPVEADTPVSLLFNNYTEELLLDLEYAGGESPYTSLSFRNYITYSKGREV